MKCVTTVRDFALNNTEDLRRFMIYKTGIRDADIIMETIQEFYVKLIETRALESYDPSKGTFKTYIMNLFCWLFPIQAKKNASAKYNFITCTKDKDSRGQRAGDYTDIFEEVSSGSSGPYLENHVDPCYNSSHAWEQEEWEGDQNVRKFIDHVRRTQPKSYARRIIPYIHYRNCGCNGADVAKIFGVSNNMVKIIKERVKASYEEWKGHKMTPGKKSRKITFQEIADEIRDVQELIKRFNAGDWSLPEGFSYKEAVQRLQYLRVRQAQIRRKPKQSCE